MNTDTFIDGAARAIADWVVGLSFDGVPNEAIERAKMSIFDTLGVIFAGSCEPPARIAREIAVSDGGVPAASVLGSESRLPVEAAALVNGVAAHALDYDDNNDYFQGHPSAVILPAILSVAEMRKSSSRVLLEAYVAGVEVMAYIGRVLGTRYYSAGWHATSIAGTIGSAAAVGKVLGLGADEIEMAVGIAVSQASGTRQNFGTMTKPLHVGHAARSGVEAARLAERGFTADPQALDGPLGLFRLLGAHGASPDPMRASLGAPFELVSHGITIKAYPCCSATHRVLDAILELRRTHDLAPSDVSSVAVTIPVGDVEPLIERIPRTGLEAKFNMQYCVAAAIYDGVVSAGSFTNEMVDRPAVRELSGRVHVAPHDAASGQPQGAGEGVVFVTVRTRAGTELRREAAHPRGSSQRPLQRHELMRKFVECTRDHLPPERAERIESLVWRLESDFDVAQLVDALRLR